MTIKTTQTAETIFTYLQNTPVAYAISKTNHLVGAGLQVVHIAGFLILLTAAVLINLRLFNAAFADRPFAQIARTPLRLLWWGLSIAVVSGVLMFIASAVLYASKNVFSIKIISFVVAALVQVAVYVLFLRKALISPTAATAISTRLAALLSLLLWLVVAAAGRGIGFF